MSQRPIMFGTVLAVRKYRLLIAAALVGTLVCWGIATKHRRNYPFGTSHCCSKVLALSLSLYAESEGSFPAGGTTPEASLSLLEKNVGAMLPILRGKTISREMTEAAYRNNGRLGPDSCGWFYIEGMGTNDDPRLALVWDKYGLDHNGKRLKGGGHEVITVDGEVTLLAGKRWDEFLMEQRKLFRELRPDLLHVFDSWTTNHAGRDSRSDAVKKASGL